MTESNKLKLTKIDFSSKTSDRYTNVSFLVENSFSIQWYDSLILKLNFLSLNSKSKQNSNTQLWENLSIPFINANFQSLGMNSKLEMFHFDIREKIRMIIIILNLSKVH
jgi:hypothetical protein